MFLVRLPFSLRSFSCCGIVPVAGLFTDCSLFTILRGAFGAVRVVAYSDLICSCYIWVSAWRCSSVRIPAVDCCSLPATCFALFAVYVHCVVLGLPAVWLILLLQLFTGCACGFRRSAVTCIPVDRCFDTLPLRCRCSGCAAFSWMIRSFDLFFVCAVVC